MLNHPLQGHGASPYWVWTHRGYLLCGGGLDSPASDFGKPCVLYKCVFPANKDSIQKDPSAKNKICTTHEWVTRYAGPVDVDSGYSVGLSLIRAGLWGKQVLTLSCGWIRRSPVEWRFNGSSVPPWQTHKGSLTLLNTTHSMEGNYSCHDERGSLLQSIKLRLGRKSASTIQESLVSCFDSQCDSFDKTFENKGLNNCLSVDVIFNLVLMKTRPQWIDVTPCTLASITKSQKKVIKNTEFVGGVSGVHVRLHDHNSWLFPWNRNCDYYLRSSQFTLNYVYTIVWSNRMPYF